MGNIIAQKANTIYVPIFDAPYTLPRAVAQPIWCSYNSAILQDGFDGFGFTEAMGFTETQGWPSGTNPPPTYTASPSAITRLNYTWLTLASGINTFVNLGGSDYSNRGPRNFSFVGLTMQGVSSVTNAPLSGGENNPMGLFQVPTEIGTSRTLSGIIPYTTVNGFTDQNTQTTYNGTYPLNSGQIVMLLNGKLYVGAPCSTAYPNQIIHYGYNVNNPYDIARVAVTPFAHGFTDSFLSHFPNLDANVAMYNTSAGSQYVRLLQYGYSHTAGAYVTFADNLVSFDDPAFGGQGNTIQNVPTGFLWNPQSAVQTSLCILDPSGLFYHPLVLQPQTASAYAALASQHNATYAPSPGFTIDAQGYGFIVSNAGSSTPASRYVGYSFATNFVLPHPMGTVNLSPLALPCFSPCATIGNLPIR